VAPETVWRQAVLVSKQEVRCMSAVMVGSQQRVRDAGWPRQVQPRDDEVATAPVGCRPLEAEAP